MKTRLALLITAALLVVGLPIPAHADTPFAFTVSEGGDATITGYTGTTPADLVIPDEITDANGTHPVTTIGTYAFYNKQLTDLTLPDTLTTIGAYAFYDNQLTNLTLPNSLTALGEAAFGINQLTELTLPDTLTTISDHAFYDNRLTDVTLPSALTVVGGFAFHENRLTELTLPNTLTTIGTYAFYGNQLTELTLSNALTTVGTWAFASNQLTDLDLPNTLTTVSDGAFFSNQLTELTLPNALTTIGNYAFRHNQLAELAVSASVTSIGQNAFDGNPGLDDVRFTGTAPQLGDYALGASDPAVRFPWKFGDPRAVDGYTTPTWNGYDTIAVAHVTFDRSGATSTNPAVQQLDVGALATKPADPVNPGSTFTGWYLPDAGAPFDFTTPIAGDITLTAGYQSGIAPVLTGPATATVQLGDAFAWTPTTLTGDPVPSVTATGLPDGLEIDDETGVISGTVTDPALAGDHEVTITATNGIAALPDATFELTISIEYFTYSVADGEATITGYHGTTPADLVIPAEVTDDDGTYPVTTIGDSAFLSSQLTDLTLPSTLTTISYAAFSDNRLTELALPDTLTTIGTAAFSDNQLTELTLPDTLTTIGNSAFIVNQLTELTLPNTLTTIGSTAFAVNQLTELTLPNALTTIGSYAFYDNQLTELAVPTTVTSIGQESFADNPELDDVRFTGITPELGDDALGTGDPTVRFPWKFDQQRVEGGYTTPTWNGYTTIAVADVTFTGAGDIAAQSIDVDGTAVAVKPADPTKAGHVFTGWFADAATTPFDFATTIVGDIVLTAGFEPAAVPPPGTPVPTPAPADPAITGLDPAIAGNAREGTTLTAKPGKLSPSGTTVTYQWQANGKAIKGATKPSLKLRKAQAGNRITVSIIAKAAGAPSVTKTSIKTKPVSSAKRRLILSTYTVGKNQPVTVTATGFKARQKVTIWLGGDNRYTGRADSRGVLSKTVTFAKDTKAGTRRVRVSGYQANGDRNRTVHTTVKYR